MLPIKHSEHSVHATSSYQDFLGVTKTEKILSKVFLEDIEKRQPYNIFRRIFLDGLCSKFISLSFLGNLFFSFLGALGVLFPENIINPKSQF